MKKLKILYILSMVVLGLLVALTVFRPMAIGRQYTEVQQQSLVRRDDGWLIKLDILNHEGKDVTYNIDVLVDGQLTTSTVLVRSEKAFTYIKEVALSMVTAGNVSVTVSKEGDSAPIEAATYYLK